MTETTHASFRNRLTPKELEIAKSCHPAETGIVYAIYCTSTNRCYVGHTAGHWYEFEGSIRRIKEHQNLLNKGIHPSRQLQHDWDYYDKDAFILQIPEIIPLPGANVETGRRKWGYKNILRKREAFWQTKLGAVYSQRNHLVFKHSITRSYKESAKPQYSNPTAAIKQVSVLGCLSEGRYSLMNKTDQAVQVTLLLPKDIYERVAQAAVNEQQQLEDLLSTLVIVGLDAQATTRELLEHVSEQYRSRLAHEGKLHQSPDEVLQDLRNLREQLTRELYP